MQGHGVEGRVYFLECLFHWLPWDFSRPIVLRTSRMKPWWGAPLVWVPSWNILAANLRDAYLLGRYIAMCVLRESFKWFSLNSRVPWWSSRGWKLMWVRNSKVRREFPFSVEWPVDIDTWDVSRHHEHDKWFSGSALYNLWGEQRW